MIDSAQVVIFVVVVILTTLIVVIGVQVYSLLKELRRSLEKVNKILDDSGTISGTVARRVTGISEIIDGASNALSIFKPFLRRIATRKRE